MTNKSEFYKQVEKYNNLKNKFEKINFENVNYLEKRTELIKEFTKCKEFINEIVINDFDYYSELKQLENILAKGFYYRKYSGIDKFIDVDYEIVEDKANNDEEDLFFNLPNGNIGYTKK